jgi:PTS system mannose-specific IIC component
VDLVSLPQALLSRPLVAALGAGLILGDVPTALRVGLLLELFALDVLPVGASRYPDYGAATVGAVLVAGGAAGWQQSLGVATLFGLAIATLGGWTLKWHREAGGRALHTHAAGLAAGDAATIARLHRRGISGDIVRSFFLTLLALLLAGVLLGRLTGGNARLEYVTAVAAGAGLAAALGGAIRSAGRGARLHALAIGTALGVLLLVLQ